MKNIFDIKNKIIIITGGAGFLGSEFAMAISNARATPVVLDKNDLALKSLKKKFIKKKYRGKFISVDINNERKVNETINSVKNIKI